MLFNDYIKSAREKKGLTQEKAAELIEGVSINTIQNWERNTLPDRVYWEAIIKTYDLNKNEFFKKYGDSVIPERNEEFQFPDFLFPIEEMELEKLKKIVLTKEEQEFIGVALVSSYSIFEQNWKNTDFPRFPLPYPYIEKVGAFKILAMKDEVKRKIDGYEKFVVEYLTAHPDEIFDINNLSVDGYVKLMKDIRIKDCNENKVGHTMRGSTSHTKSLYDFLKIVVHWITLADEAGGEYLIDEKSQGDASSIDALFKFNNKIASRYISIQERNDSYKEKMRQYQRDIALHTEGIKISEKEFQEPAPYIERYVTITEEGINLLNWYRKNADSDCF